MFDSPQQWQISTGDIFELLRPATHALAVVLSALVLADTRRRRFPTPAVLALTLATLLLPHVALPLYLITYLLRRTHKPADNQPDETNTSGEPAITTTTTTTTTAIPALTTTTRAPDLTTGNADTPNVAATPDVLTTPVQRDSQEPAARPRLLFVLPALYALALLACVALYTYLDYQSFDAHLTRAANARLRYQHERAIREYTAALALHDDPRTRLLLATQLSDAKRFDEALREFLAAERGGEPDPRLPFHIASTLHSLKRPDEALPYYQKFLSASICAHTSPDARCRDAQERLKKITAETVR